MTVPTSKPEWSGDYGNHLLDAVDPAGAGRGVAGFGRAHGKVILLGEHAVVYGAAALAVPIPELTVTARAARSSNAAAGAGGISVLMTGSAAGPVGSQVTEGLQRLMVEFTETAGIIGSSGVDVRIDCAIPLGRGLGASAACARAVVLALADLADCQLDAGAVFDLVQVAESVAHGKPSGVDALATGSPCPILFRSGTAQQLGIGVDGVIVVADSGVAGRTSDAVELLWRRFQRHPGSQSEFLSEASTLTDAAVRDLADGRARDFGARLTAYHELLREAGLSTDRIDALAEAAVAAGSLGAKISGGGLGGCMIALAGDRCQARRIARRLLDAGAVGTWCVPLERFADHDC